MAIENGAPPSAGDVQEAVAINNASLSEDCGEGYHRQTHQTIQHGNASKTPWVLASTRELQNLHGGPDVCC